MGLKCFLVEQMEGEIVEAFPDGSGSVTYKQWRRPDTGEVFKSHRGLPPGAMYFAPWLSQIEEYRGPDGKCLCVVCPNGKVWIIDSRASNCDSLCKKCGKPYNHQSHHKYDEKTGEYGCSYEESRPHKCWCRHGVPPNVTVNKAGVTCNAGGGSIQAGDYHGHLTNGEFNP